MPERKPYVNLLRWRDPVGGTVAMECASYRDF